MIDLVEQFLLHAIAGDARSGVGMILELLDAGTHEEDIISLLSVAQREVGERWHDNRLSVADEHLATGVVESVLYALDLNAPRAREGSFVVVACAEGDWHAVAAHMFAVQLRSRGVEVALLGASTPASQLDAFLAARTADALAISCNVPLFFPGVASLADAAHAHGVPVLAGGRSLEGGNSRACRLGADGSASSITAAMDILGVWQGDPPATATAPTVLDAVAQDLRGRADALAVRAADDLTRRFGAMGHYSLAQLERTREDLAYIVTFVAAALLVDDGDVLTDFLEWLRQLLAARGVPPAALLCGLEALQPLLAVVGSDAAHLVGIGIEHLGSTTEVGR